MEYLLSIVIIILFVIYILLNKYSDKYIDRLATNYYKLLKLTRNKQTK